MDKKTEREIREKLQAEENKWTLNKHFGEKYNKYTEAAIIFFGTLGPLYLLFFIAYRAFMFAVGAAGVQPMQSQSTYHYHGYFLSFMQLFGSLPSTVPIERDLFWTICIGDSNL